jgi:hypothetical protein
MRKVILSTLVFCIIFSNLFLQVVYGEAPYIPPYVPQYVRPDLAHNYDYTWTKSVSTPYTSMNYGAFGKGIFVAVGQNGIIKTSSDGQSWQSRESGTYSSLFTVAFNGQVFVAAGADGTIITSSDGIKWTIEKTDTSSTFTKVVWNGNIFVAIGYTYDIGVLYTSQDGINWTQRMLKTADSFSDMEWTGKLFVCVGRDGVVYTSQDGVKWDFKNVGNSIPLLKLAFNGDLMVAVTNSDVTFTSKDGINWTLEKMPENKHWWDIIWNGECFVAIGINMDWVIEMSSKDGHTWSKEGSSNVSEICSNGSVRLGESFSGLKVSTDGESWMGMGVSILIPPPRYRSISYNATTLVTIGDNGVYAGSDILVSTDKGAIWVNAYTTSQMLNDIEWNNDFFMAVGNKGTVLKSYDGLKWSIVESGISEDLVGITYGCGILAALSADGKIYTSIDGEKWVLVSSFENKRGKDVIWNGQCYVALANAPYGETADKSPSVLISRDGIVWSGKSLDITGSIDGLSLCDGKVVATDSYNKKLYFTENGLEWDKKDTNLEFNTVIWDNSYKYIAGCNDGQIYISEDLETWTRSSYISNSTCKLICLKDKVIAVGSGITMGLKTYSIIPRFKISGYVSPDFTDGTFFKSDFTIELTGSGIGIRDYTDEKGYFEIDGIPGNLKGCTLKIMKKNYLTKVLKEFTVNGDGQLSSPESPIPMWAGDIAIGNSQDNCINMVDVIELSKYFNSSKGDPIYREDRDLNLDSAINIQDVIILAKHFNSATEL